MITGILLRAKKYTKISARGLSGHEFRSFVEIQMFRLMQRTENINR